MPVPLADSANLYKRLRFYGVKLVTVDHGENSRLHIAMSGVINETYLADVADQVRRGLRARVLEGKAAGRESYGYDVVMDYDAAGEPIRGLRAINPKESEVIVEALTWYADGIGPTSIVSRLTARRIPGFGGGEWNVDAIRGSQRFGTGLINNELYIGILVWNRTHLRD